MKTGIKKLQDKIESTPYLSVTQTNTSMYHIYKCDLSKLIDCHLIANICIELQKESTNLEKRGLNLRLDKVVKAEHSYAKTPEEFEPFHKLFDLVLQKIENIDTRYSYYVDHFWTNVYRKNDSAIVHNHKKDITVDFACVFYPLVDELSSPITFINNNSEIDVPVKTGTLLVFSGDVYHLVKPQSVDRPRISIAMNTFKKQLKNRPNMDTL